MEEVKEQQSQSLDQVDDSEIVAESAAFVKGEPLQDKSGPPKVDSEVEVLHEKVTKQIIKKGHGQKPSKYSNCFLHYRAWTESTKHKFEDTWEEQHPTEIVLGKDSEIDKSDLSELLGRGALQFNLSRRRVANIRYEEEEEMVESDPAVTLALPLVHLVRISLL